jgi:hypothetical protein
VGNAVRTRVCDACSGPIGVNDQGIDYCSVSCVVFQRVVCTEVGSGLDGSGSGKSGVCVRALLD